MHRRVGGRRLLAVAVVLSLAVVVDGGRTPGPDAGAGAGLDRVLAGTEPDPWQAQAGVEQITVTGAAPGQPLTLYGPGGRRLLTLLADEAGQAHFAYLPAEHATVRSGPDLDYAALGDLADGSVVTPGTYVVVDDEARPRRATERVRVPDLDDVPDPGLYERQELTGARLDLVGDPVPGASPEDGFHYLEMRDGVSLSAMVRFPEASIYGEPPYPTVVEYSGYGPSNPAAEEPGSRLARALGYATVSVNMRGTGCSGGVFDLFNAAQAADGYDVIEIVGRQPWVRGGQVGMVGLSYSGIAQLYVAATRPPHLAAVTPQSVIADPWLQQWPGGIYNSGFTEQWLTERDRQSAPGGTGWVSERVAAGDDTCAAHQALRRQNPDFRAFGRSLDAYPDAMAARDLRRLVPAIDVPVYLTGAFQDEQTGPQFAALLDELDAAPVLRASLWNGRHPDGFAPANVVDWFEFLELYVAERVPRMDPALRAALPAVLAGEFGLEDAALGPDRLAERYGDDLEAARAAYDAEDPVRVTFESGAGDGEVGEPGGSFEQAFPAWPPPGVEAATWYLGDGGRLTEAPPAGSGGADTFRFDAEAGGATLFGGTGEYPLMSRLWPGADWTRFDDAEALAYDTAPLTEDTVVTGPGHARLWVRSEADDVAVQVSVSEVRPDGVEYLVQTGWLRLEHRAVDAARSGGLRVVHPFTRDAERPVRPGEWVEAAVAVPAFAHPVRAGSRLRLTVATPGRNHATWEFENPASGSEPPVHTVGRSAAHPSSLVLGTLDDVPVPGVLPPCPSLRGQPCRPAEQPG